MDILDWFVYGLVFNDVIYVVTMMCLQRFVIFIVCVQSYGFDMRCVYKKYLIQ